MQPKIQIDLKSRRLIPLSCALILPLGCAFLVAGQTNYQRTYSFGPSSLKGSSPRGNLIQATDGCLYGVTYAGGSNNWGTVFKVASNGTAFETLHHFTDSLSLPISGLVEVPEGSLWGLIASGGDYGGGVIYKLEKNGTGFGVLHNFNGGIAEGTSPLGTLINGNDGFFYGTTATGGSNNIGTVFKIDVSGANYSTVYHLSGTAAKNPSGTLTLGPDGWLYGTTVNGGSADMGTVFKVSKAGTSFTVLHTFRGKALSDGQDPVSGLIQGPTGVLYGTTYSGGNADAGTVFRLNTNGTDYAVVYHFQVAPDTGALPVSCVTYGSGDYLYGTTSLGGSGNWGVAFRMNTNGAGYTVLHSFNGTGGDGSQPYSPLLLANDGCLYGSTTSGGDYTQNGANGTVFRLSLTPLPGTLSVLDASSASVLLKFQDGAYARLYEVQRRQFEDTQWTTIGSQTARIDGSFEFTDATNGLSTAFYRTVTR